jgi:hypothetical protein
VALDVHGSEFSWVTSLAGAQPGHRPGLALLKHSPQQRRRQIVFARSIAISKFDLRWFRFCGAVAAGQRVLLAVDMGDSACIESFRIQVIEACRRKMFWRRHFDAVFVDGVLGLSKRGIGFACLQ